MNKMKKLLSVLLAVVMILSSMTVMASAAKTAYKTVDDLTALDAYSPYGQVTRLSLEERTSIVMDALDNILGKAGIKPGTLVNISWLGLVLDVDLTSVNGICYTLDTVKSTIEGVVASLGKTFLDLGILEDLDTGTWPEENMTRDNTANFTIISELLELLSNNTTVVERVFNEGLNLGTLNSVLGSLDLSSIEAIIGNLPGLIKGLIYPLIERWDDTLTDIQTYDNNIAKGDSVEEIANNRIKALLSDDMSITTIKYDANGNMTSEHTTWLKATGSVAPDAPTAASPRYYYQISGTTPGSTMTVYHIVDAKEAEELAKDTDDSNNVAAYNYIAEEQQYTLTEEAGNGVYVWKAFDKNNNVVATLKWYNDNSPLLEGISGDDIDLREGMSAGDILYKFMPVLFEEMAPVVLNGSVKWALSKFVGVQWTYVGEVGSDAVNELADANDTFFTQEQGEYIFEWSDYQVINGNHYYRFEDQIWASSLDNVNNYFDIINWNYKVEANLFNKYVPTSDNDASVRLLTNTADFLTDVAELVLLPSAETDDTRTDYTATWTRPTFAKGNANLVSNVKALAQAIVKLAPQHIFGDDYKTNERCYVDLMLSDNNDTVLTGIAAQLVDMIMPSMSLPGKSEILASGAKVGAILAAVVREFAISLAPEYNFDALIYKTYENGTKTFVTPSAAGLVTSGDTEADYWLDVILTMGLNVGFEYLRAFADMGEGTTQWNSFVSYSGYGETGKTYAANTTQAALNAEWEGMLDYIVDWALESEVEWAWAFENLVNTTGLTIDLATAQDPWVKLDQILGSLLPVTEILTVAPGDGETNMEHWLRDDLILGIVNLKWDHLIDTLQFNGTNKYFRTDNVLDQLAKLLKNVINGIFAKVGGGSYALIPSAITDFDTLANQNNLVTMVKELVGKLYTAGVSQGGCRTLFPFLNFLLGWKTDPQQIADPQIWTSFRDGNDYAFQWTGQDGYPAIDSNSTKIVILNNSSGMLETHRNSDVKDHVYDINIRSITSDATVNKLTFTYDNVISPYETVEVKIGGTYNGDEAVTVTIEYDYIGKDGKAVGGTQYTSVSFLVSNLYEDANYSGLWTDDDDNDYTGLSDYKAYVFTEDIYQSVIDYTAEIHYVSASFSNPDKSFEYCQPYGYVAPSTSTDCNGNTTTDPGKAGEDITGRAAQYFDQYFGNESGEWASTLSKSGTSSTTAHMYHALDGVTADTFKPTGTTDADIAKDSIYGIYDMGDISVKYGKDEKQVNVDFIYYNDFNIYDIYTENKDNGYNANQGVDSETWEAYRVAWNKIVYLATYPMMTTARNDANEAGETAKGTSANDYVTVIQPQIPAAIEAYEAAEEAYETALAEAEANANASSSADSKLPSAVQDLADALAEDDNDGEKEINFRDYDFYEYFNYADLRTSHRNFVKTYYAPEVMDQYYILNSGIRQAELEKVIAAEDNKVIAAGIDASKLENKAEDIAASKVAAEEWQMPINSDLLVEDMAARLRYYRSFVNDSVKEDVATMNVYLNKEIMFVEAQNLVEADYTADSWAAYAEALAKAKAIYAGEETYDGEPTYATFVSSSFDAKYNLMVAYKNLLKKADSLIEAGGTDKLNANIETANAIFASMNAADGAWTLAADYEGEAEAAYAQLISALGYYYVGEDGNTWNLYADSALEYADNDRPNRQANQAKVDTANANLEAAIANFEAAVTEPATIMVKEDFEYAEYVVIDTNNTNNGEYTGIIYGIDVFDQNMYMEALAGSLADALTTSQGDDYLVITANEQGVESTGTLIEVVDADGNAVETYVFIYFGDIDGDGMISGNDSYIASEYEITYEGINSFAEYVAADVDGDGMPSGNDGYLMGEFEISYSDIDYQYNMGQNAVNNYYEWLV